MEMRCKKMEQILVLKVEPFKYPKPIMVDNTLEALQKEVKGYIEIVYPFDKNIAIICNEEGKIKGLPLNRGLYDEDDRLYDIIAGTFLAVSVNGEGDIVDMDIDDYLFAFNRFLLPENWENIIKKC